MTHPGQERPVILPEPRRDENGIMLAHEFENDVPLLTFDAVVSWRPDHATKTLLFKAINQHYYGAPTVPPEERPLTVDHREAAYNVPRGAGQTVRMTLYSSGRCAFET